MNQSNLMQKTGVKKGIAIVAVLAVFAVLATALLAYYRPTASATRSDDTMVKVYGVGGDDVSLAIDGTIYPATVVNHAEDRHVYTDGYAEVEHNGETYLVYFTSVVAQGKGTYIVEFSLEESLAEIVSATCEFEPEYCQFSVSSALATDADSAA